MIQGISDFVNDCKNTFNDSILPTAITAGKAFTYLMMPREKEANENTAVYCLKEGFALAGKLTAIFAVAFIVVSLVKPLFITAGILLAATGLYILGRNAEIAKSNINYKSTPWASKLDNLRTVAANHFMAVMMDLNAHMTLTAN